MAECIIESDMSFIPNNTFRIETSSLYKNIGEGILSVEFIRVRDSNLMFVEAKKTFPNPDNPSKDNLEEFHEEIKEICNKFKHSLNLFSSITAGVASTDFADDFLLPEKASVVFILVIKNHQLAWCKRIHTALMEALPAYLKKIWKPKVYVINHETALKRGLTYP